MFAENGPVSIKRIFRDEFVIADIIKFLTSFWIRVIAPEIFEMRVPRNLHPLILPNEIEDVVSNDITLSECSGAASNLSVSAIQVQTDSRDNSLLYENNLTAERKEVPDNSDNYTAEELEVAKLLASSLTDNFIAPSSGEGNNLVVFPWAGTTSNGFQLVNTCPVDNWLMIFQALVKSERVNLDELNVTGQVISNALNLINQDRYSDAKVEILPHRPRVRSNIIDFYAGEDELFLQHMSPYMKSGTSTSCQSETCPHPIDFVTSSHITLDYPVGCTVEQNIVLKALDSWLHPYTTRCGRKFPDQPPQGALYFESESLDDNANAHVSWHCSGQRTYSPRVMLNLKSFVIVSVDVLSRPNNNLPILTMDQVPAVISISGKDFSLFGATLWNGSHYISMFQFDGVWLMYDGIKEYNRKGSGIVYSHTKFKEPQGYSLSYLVYCI